MKKRIYISKLRPETKRKSTNSIKLMGVRPAIDRELLLKQVQFENSLDVKCPICDLIFPQKQLPAHLYSHDVNNFEIDELYNSKYWKVKCPLCMTYVPKGKQFRHHLRKSHFMHLHKIGGGIYESFNSHSKRKIEQNYKANQYKKIVFKKRIVSGGLPSLGKKK
ncbi:hypothetical protein HGB07_00910 [Candidatus Roizmanbacteria bacterium]|nr:hypothetical protein [Candidatus Roizmanbacteria bacterium]